MIQTITIKLKDVHCESCEHTIEKVLSSADGVLRVTPSAKTNDVKISYNEDKVDVEKLRVMLAEIGYEAEI